MTYLKLLECSINAITCSSLAFSSLFDICTWLARYIDKWIFHVFHFITVRPIHNDEAVVVQTLLSGIFQLQYRNKCSDI